MPPWLRTWLRIWRQGRFKKIALVNITSFCHMNIETCPVRGRRKKGGRRPWLPWILKFEIFLLNFWQKRLFSWLRLVRMKFHNFCLPLEKSFCLPLEKSAIGPPWKKSFRRPWSCGHTCCFLRHRNQPDRHWESCTSETYRFSCKFLALFALWSADSTIWWPFNWITYVDNFFGFVLVSWKPKNKTFQFHWISFVCNKYSTAALPKSEFWFYQTRLVLEKCSRKMLICTQPNDVGFQNAENKPSVFRDLSSAIYLL